MEEEIDDTTKKLVSDFNEAKFQIIRLNIIWIDLRTARESGKLHKAKDILDSAQIELATDAARLDESIKEEKEKYSSRISTVSKEIIDALIKKDNIEAYNKLKEKEVLLRILQEKAGKGGKFSDEEDEMM